MHRAGSLLLGTGLALAAAACGSGSTGDFTSYAGGGPASQMHVHDAGSSSGSSSGGGSSGGSSGASSSGGSGGSGGSSGSSSGGADAGVVGNENTTSFTLINTAITTLPAGAAVNGYDPIKYGAMIDLALVGDQLNIRADPPPVAAIGSIAFALDATYTHTANTAPYSLCGDDGPGKFNPCPLTPGKHTLTVTPYPLQDLAGMPYTPTTFEFTVLDSNATDAGTD
jgi:hypothetical protein